MRLEMLRQQEIRRQRMEVALAHLDHARREGRQHGAADLRPRLLVGLAHVADAEMERARLGGRYFEAVVGQVDIVGRLALPDRQDHVDRLGEDLVAVLVEDAERFGVGGERARADPEDEAALRQVIEHGGLAGDQDRVLLRQVGGAGGELDLGGGRDQGRQERHAVGDILAAVGQVLAHEGAAEAQFVGQDDGLAVLLERLRPVPVQRMHRHGEITQSHSMSSGCGGRHMTRLRGRGKAAMRSGFRPRMSADSSCPAQAADSIRRAAGAFLSARHFRHLKKTAS